VVSGRISRSLADQAAGLPPTGVNHLGLDGGDRRFICRCWRTGHGGVVSGGRDGAAAALSEADAIEVVLDLSVAARPRFAAGAGCWGKAWALRVQEIRAWGEPICLTTKMTELRPNPISSREIGKGYSKSFWGQSC
jgi:hypothetical protein